ncbi:hypothetical protein BDW74DRAFT_181182 [Aspergillus multicolor]|uniref:fungal specific transcription factor domain-containing protein n=1 Tax=Aspergillus multicolor TaxID=41759 RepID=UPI003CCD6F2B
MPSDLRSGGTGNLAILQEISRHSGPAADHPRLKGFPELQPADCDTLIAEHSAHVGPMSSDAYQSIVRLCETYGIDRLPERTVLDTFLQLYFEYFDPSLPFVHPSLFDREDTPWLLVLAVATVGSQFTAIGHRAPYTVGLIELLKRALPTDSMVFRSPNLVVIAQSELLYGVSLLFCGYRDCLTLLERQRGWLATLIQAITDDTGPFRTRTATSPWHWPTWIQEEGRRRLVYCAFIFDSMASILLDIEPRIHGAHIDLPTPCGQPLWKAMSAQEWQARCAAHSNLTMRPGLRALLGNLYASNSVRGSSDLPELARTILLFAFWLDERSAVQGARKLAAMRGQNSSASFSACSRDLDDLFAALEPAHNQDQPFNSSPDSALHPRSVYYRVLWILRQVPLRTLHTCCGWRVSRSDTQKARHAVSEWMRAHPQTAREAFVHAATAFSMFRHATGISCLHPLWMLIPVEYLRFYQQEHTRVSLAPEAPSVTSSRTSKSHGHDGAQSPRTRSGASVVRIKPGPIGPDTHLALSKWIAGTEHLSLYLPGVGLLLEERSAACLMREFQRILDDAHGLVGWPLLRRRLRLNIAEILHEIVPLTQPPYLADIDADNADADVERG